MRWILIIIVALSGMFGGCAYNRLLKSDDLTKKYEAANRYYEKGKYYKAMPLLEELIPIYRGTEKAERLFYIYAYSDYYMKDYILAAHRFETFVNTFPFSRYTEECAFMGAICHYKLSPKYSLDQYDTYQAIKQFELFVHQYPDSKYLDSSHVMLDVMRVKLDEKSFQIGKQYYRTHKYRASIVTLENHLVEFPDTDHREEIYFIMVQANYYWAKNSVASKKQERYINTKKAYTKFASSFPNSRFANQAKEMLEKANENLKEIADKSS